MGEIDLYEIDEHLKLCLDKQAKGKTARMLRQCVAEIRRLREGK